MLSPPLGRTQPEDSHPGRMSQVRFQDWEFELVHTGGRRHVHRHPATDPLGPPAQARLK